MQLVYKHPCYYYALSADLRVFLLYNGTDEYLNLDNLLIQLRPHITPQWYQFGVAVGVTKEVLDKCLGYPPEECVVEVLDYWLRTTRPTWKDVAEGLRTIGFLNLAQSISKVYKTGE